MVSWLFVAFYFVACSIYRSETFSWILNSEPRQPFVYDSEKLDTFYGNDSYVDYFKLLLFDHSTILVGSRNVVFNLSLTDLSEIRRKRIEWPPTGAHRELCVLKGKSEENCHNYIRVGSYIDKNSLLICGSNAYKPLCREYNVQESKHVREFEGLGWCPYDPDHNSTYIFADGQLYSATAADFSGLDTLIYRDPLRTEFANLKQLNEPNFVSAVEHEDYVLFFFRESAVEFINCGKVVYSRVARVCKKDKGGPHSFSGRWTSYIKARLNCSVPGDYPFYFNEIQGTSQIVEGDYGDNRLKLIYGIFTTPSNSIGGSSVCAFSINDIMDTFDNGPFKGQENMNSNWLRVQPSKVPEDRPGKCVNDSRTLPDVAVNFVKKHSLMDEPVTSFGHHPILIQVTLRNKFTAIAVDPQIKSLHEDPMDILFIGTDEGHILKSVHRYGDKPSSFFIEDVRVKHSNMPIKSLSVLRLVSKNPKLLIITDDAVQTIPLYRCKEYHSCRECVGVRDPYCAWDNIGSKCIAHEDVFSKKHLLQDLVGGVHPSCEEPGMVNELEDPEVKNCPKCATCSHKPCSNNVEQPIVGTQEKIVIYTADTLGMVVATSVLATLVVGFVAGYFCSRHFRPETAYTNMPPLHAHTTLNRLSDSNIHGESASYLSPNNKSLNLVVNVPPKTANDKNANTASDKTLQKIKKTYI